MLKFTRSGNSTPQSDHIAVLGNEKVRLENEMLSLANTNKNLASEYEVKFTELHAQFKAKRTEKENELKKLDDDLASKRSDLKKLTEDNEALIFTNKTLSTSKLELEGDVRLKEIERNGLHSDIEYAKVNLKKSVDEKSQAEKEKKVIVSEVSKLEIEILGLKSTKDTLLKGLDVLDGQLNIKQTQIVSLDTDIKSKLAEIEILKSNIFEATDNLVILHKEASDMTDKLEVLKAENIKKSNEIKAEMGNLALLDKRIEDRMDTLRQYESKFTVDELAKMKYNRILNYESNT